MVFSWVYRGLPGAGAALFGVGVGLSAAVEARDARGVALAVAGVGLAAAENRRMGRKIGEGRAPGWEKCGVWGMSARAVAPYPGGGGSPGLSSFVRGFFMGKDFSRRGRIQ